MVILVAVRVSFAPLLVLSPFRIIALLKGHELF